MDLASVMLVVLGLLFFGGIGYLVWRERKREVPQETTGASGARSNGSQKEEAVRQKRPGR